MYHRITLGTPIFVLCRWIFGAITNTHFGNETIAKLRPLLGLPKLHIRAICLRIKTNLDLTMSSLNTAGVPFTSRQTLNWLPVATHKLVIMEWNEILCRVHHCLNLESHSIHRVSYQFITMCLNLIFALKNTVWLHLDMMPAPSLFVLKYS